MRLFAAIEISEAVIDEIAAWWQGACLQLPAGEWRDVPKQNWHLTLAFYGDVAGQDVDRLTESPRSDIDMRRTPQPFDSPDIPKNHSSPAR